MKTGTYLGGAAALLTTVSLCNTAHAQEAFGARALGMGGAFTALAEGEASALWNPAGAAFQRGGSFFLPTMALQSRGAFSANRILGGLPSGWDRRFDLAKKAATGTTDVRAHLYTGIGGQGWTLSLAGFGTATANPIGANGAASIGLTREFTITDLRGAAVQAYQDFGSSLDDAQREADKLVNEIRRDNPDATKLALPEAGGRVNARGSVYGAGMLTLARPVRPNVALGLNVRVVAAQGYTATADLSGRDLIERASDATGGTASPAIVNRLLRRLDLRTVDGSYYSGRELAGDIATSSTSGGLEVRPALDFGAIWRVNRGVQAGAVVRNLLPARFTSADPLNTHVDLGVAWYARSGMLLAADATNLLDSKAAHLNFGAEWRPVPLLALRTGLYRGRLTYGVGLGRGLNLAVASGASLLSFGLRF